MATWCCSETLVAGFYIERHAGPDPGCERDGKWSPEVATLGKEEEMDNRQKISAGASHTTAGASWLNILLGIWVIISPFAVQFAQLPAAMWNNVIVGIVIAILAIIRTSTPRQAGWSWVNVILGIWMIISPFALGVMTTAIVSNNIILGIVIALIASGSASLRAP